VVTSLAAGVLLPFLFMLPFMDKSGGVGTLKKWSVAELTYAGW
jgi:hypothetical protein